MPVRYDRDLSNPSREIVPWLLMPRSLPDRLGMDPPETVDDFIAMLRAIKAQGLKGRDGRPMIPFGLGEAELYCLDR